MGTYFRISSREGGACSLSDEELMRRYQDGDEAAFEEIYGRYAKRIYGFLMRRLGQPDDCAELFQETFLRLHRSRSLYRPAMPFKAWVYTIANNLIRDRVRSNGRLGVFQVLEENEDSPGGMAPSGFHHLIGFNEALFRLTGDQREAFMLSRLEGLKYEEIGRVMGRSTEAVNQLIQRALRQLRKCIDEI